MKIVISGLGVMGASLALAIKNSGIKQTIYGYDRPEVLSLALEKKIIDAPVSDWPGSLDDVDLIFLATPINIIKSHLADLNGKIGPGTVVTDIGSTKSEIKEYCKSIRFSGTYIGSHPMTGAEKSGLQAANPLLYENAIYVLCGEKEHIDKQISAKLLPVLTAIKARIYFLDADNHDKVMAGISHLPQMIAIALMNMVGCRNDIFNHYFDLAAGGFRDLTRIASSSSQIWQDIVTTNKSNITQAISDFIDQLNLGKENLDNISSEFQKANQYRERVPKVSKGFLSPLTNVLVYVNDQIGVIAKIANALFEKNIDIRDIELLKIREKEGGVFMLSFENLQKAAEAVTVLNSINYNAFIKE